MISPLFRPLTREQGSWALTASLPDATLSKMAAPKKQQHVQRLEIHLDPSLLAWLRLEAKRLDVSMSEIIRCLLRKEMVS